MPFDGEVHTAAFYRFIEKVRGSETFANRKKALEWLHNSFPLKMRTPLRFVVTDGDRIAATMGHMPADYMIKGEQVPARITHDLLVDQDYRGQGLAKQLVDNARNTGEFLAGGMWMTGPCYKIHRSCGFDDVSAPRTRILILKPNGFAARQGVGLVKRSAVRVALGVLRSKAMRGAAAALKHSERELSISEIQEFGPHHDLVWTSMLRSYDIAACRDAAFLNWKYAHHPVVPYRMLIAERGRRVSGYLVWRLPFGKGPEHRAVIVDYLVERGDAIALRSLISEVILGASRQEVEALSMMTTQRWSLKILKDLGFLASRGEQTWVTANWGRYFSRDWLTDPDRWHVCLGDSDGDFWTGGQ
jgi:GNAT superfamily N-acetyltransferase